MIGPVVTTCQRAADLDRVWCATANTVIAAAAVAADDHSPDLPACPLELLVCDAEFQRLAVRIARSSSGTFFPSSDNDQRLLLEIARRSGIDRCPGADMQVAWLSPMSIELDRDISVGSLTDCAG